MNKLNQVLLQNKKEFLICILILIGLDALEGDDRALVAQLDAITDRRWKDAAQALGMKESTLRSRWQRVLERLRECMTERTDNPFAPRGSAGDI